LRTDAFLFGEAQGRVVVSVSAQNEAAFEALVQTVPFEKLGTVSKGDIQVNQHSFGNISLYKNIFENSLEEKLS